MCRVHPISTIIKISTGVDVRLIVSSAISIYSIGLMQTTPSTRLSTWLKLWHSWAREATAALIWGFSLIKIFIYDFDIYLFKHFAPDWEWILHFKLLILLLIISLAWLLSRQRPFLSFMAYVVFYPLIIIFWRLPKLIFRNWSLVLVFSPIIYNSFKGFRLTFAFYTLALVSIAILCFSNETQYLQPSVAFLLLFLFVQLIRKIKDASGVGLFEHLTEMTRKITGVVVSGAIFQKNGTPAFQSEPLPRATYITNAYFYHAFAELVSSKIREATHSRMYDFYLILSLIYIFILTVSVYAFAYWGLSRMNPDAFLNASPNSFLRFFHLSIGILSTAGGSSIQPNTTLSSLLVISETLCIPVIGILIVVSFFTLARERYKKDADNFQAALIELEKALEEKLISAYQLTVSQAEEIVLEKDTYLWLVNLNRRTRGLPELTKKTPDSKAT